MQYDEYETQDSSSNEEETKSRNFTVLSGTKKETGKTLGQIRDQVQLVLDRSLKISTLIGSGASATVIPLMATTFKDFEDEIACSDEPPVSKEDFTKVHGEFTKLFPAESKAYDIEAFMTWLSQRSANTINGKDGDEYNQVLNALLLRFDESVRGVNYESKEQGVPGAKELYKRFLQGLGHSREILARRERTVFDVINLFTTNYDLFHEYALLESGYEYTDGFSPGLRNDFSAKYFHMRPVDLDDRFRDRVQPVNPFFRLFKLHGSVDWQKLPGTISSPKSTIRIPQYPIKNEDDGRSKESMADSLIKPMSSKYVLTQGDPFSDLFREFVNILGEPDTVLFVAGYGFGDEHINNLIYHALQRSDFLLYAFVQKPAENSSALREFIDRNQRINAKFVFPEDTFTPYVKFEEVVRCFEAEGMKSVTGIETFGMSHGILE